MRAQELCLFSGTSVQMAVDAVADLVARRSSSKAATFFHKRCPRLHIFSFASVETKTNIFHPSPIATIQQTFLLSLVVRLFQQCHLFRIDEVMMIPLKIFTRFLKLQ